MKAILYRFEVKPDCEQEFISAWAILTQAIYDHHNSLGSRLHRIEPLVYMAYAQWPDDNTFTNAKEKPLPPDALKARSVMKNACTQIEKLHEMEVTVDLLRNPK